MERSNNSVMFEYHKPIQKLAPVSWAFLRPQIVQYTSDEVADRSG